MVDFGNRSKSEIGVLVALLLPVVITTLGLFANWESTGHIWADSVTHHLLGYLAVFLLLVFWGQVFFKAIAHSLISALGLLFLVSYSGILEFLSVSLFIVSSYCLGNLLLRWTLPGQANSRIFFLSSFALGAAVLVLFFGALILLGNNRRELYLLYLTLPILGYCWFLRTTINPWVDLWKWLPSLVSDINRLSGPKFYGFLFVAIYVTSYCLFPTVTSDEQAVHLAIWSQLEANGKFVIDPSTQIWSVAPNTVALIHAITSLVAGADSKSAMNFYLFILTLGGLFQLLGRIKLNQNDSLAVATLFVSTPIISILLVSVQTDLFLGLTLVGVALAVLSLNTDRELAALGGIFCGALALSAKLPGILIAAPVALLVLVHALRARYYKHFSLSDWCKLLGLLAVALLLAIWPYLKAYYYTGNPVFPLFNGVFQSPFARPENFKDLRWFSGANLNSFMGLFYESKSHMEVTNNFVGGFQYFLLVPVAMLLAFWGKQKQSLAIIGLMLFYLVPIYWSLQYLRYFYAALPLASVLVAIFFLVKYKSALRKNVALFGIYWLAFANFFFMPGASWLFIISPLSVLDAKSAEAFQQEMMPEVKLNRLVSETKHSPTVLFHYGRPFGATLIGKPIYYANYSYTYFSRMSQWQNSADMLSDLKTWGVDFVYWDQKEAYSKNNNFQNMSRELLLAHGKPAFQSGNLLAFSLAETRLNYQPIFIFDQSTKFAVKGNPSVSEQNISLRAGDLLSVDLEVADYSAFKYQVSYVCESEADFYVAQLNWDTGAAYYKLLGCTTENTSYAEVGMVPPGAKKATLYLSVHAKQAVNVSGLSIGVR